MAQVQLSLALLLAFLGVVVLVQTSAGLLFARRDKTTRINRRLAMFDAGMGREQVYAKLVRTKFGNQGRQELIDAWERRLRRVMQQSGVTMRLRTLLLTLAAITLGLWTVSLSFWTKASALSFMGNASVSLFACAMLTAIGAWLWLSRRRRARLKNIERQMPIALDVMTRALRAGHPVVSSIQLAAEEMGDPLGSEFGLVLDETTYGAELQEALTSLAERTGSEDVYFLAVSIAVQTETGGNLAEILESLAAVIRGRTGLSQKVKALSSEGRTSAIMLSVLPALVIGAQLVFRPHVYTDKFSDPIFWPAVTVTMSMYLVGWLAIQRIINFKY